MRILSRLPEGRGSAPYLSRAAHRRTDAAQVANRARVVDFPLHHAEGPDGIGPARGIAIAIGTGALCWAVLIAQLVPA